MESDSVQPVAMVNGCACGCNCCDPRACTRRWIRSVKRKLDELEVEREKFMIPGLMIPQVAHVEIENECTALREMVNDQQQNIHDLTVELEKERSASSSAANEAMSMILRLQREKAEIEMEARQFKRFTEQKTAHDQQEIAASEELLFKREQTIQSLTCEVQAYKYRMMSYGFMEPEFDGEKSAITRTNSVATNSESQFDHLPFDYPPLKCNSNEHHPYPESETETIDIDKYAFSDPGSLKEIEQRINQLERSPKHTQPVLEKVIVGHSPRSRKASSRFSMDSGGSFFATIKEDTVSGCGRFCCNPRCTQKGDNASEMTDETGDRIYTVDSIHYGGSYRNDAKANVAVSEELRKDSMGSDVVDPEVMKLYARLHALEADRESMRQAIINMRTDKAQLVLLKEIAQHLCKDMSPPGRLPVRKRSIVGSFFIFSVCKWIASFVLWRRKAHESKYMFGMTSRTPGLMVLFDNEAEVGQWRCISRTQL